MTTKSVIMMLGAGITAGIVFLAGLLLIDNRPAPVAEPAVNTAPSSLSGDQVVEASESEPVESVKPLFDKPDTVYYNDYLGYHIDYPDTAEGWAALTDEEKLFAERQQVTFEYRTTKSFFSGMEVNETKALDIGVDGEYTEYYSIDTGFPRNASITRQLTSYGLTIYRAPSSEPDTFTLIWHKGDVVHRSVKIPASDVAYVRVDADIYPMRIMFYVWDERLEGVTDSVVFMFNAQQRIAMIMSTDHIDGMYSGVWAL